MQGTEVGTTIGTRDKMTSTRESDSPHMLRARRRADYVSTVRGLHSRCLCLARK